MNSIHCLHNYNFLLFVILFNFILNLQMNSKGQSEERILTAVDIKNLLLQFNLGCKDPIQTTKEILNEHFS